MRYPAPREPDDYKTLNGAPTSNVTAITPPKRSATDAISSTVSYFDSSQMVIGDRCRADDGSTAVCHRTSASGRSGAIHREVPSVSERAVT